MKKLDLSGFFRGSREQQNRIAVKGGTYSLALTAIVLAILIAVNIFASVLPSRFTKYDISASRLYSVTSSTKAVVNALSEDVKIYWVVQADKEDEVIENLLDKYEALSDHISVEKKNPDVYPTFTAQYTDASVPNNSLIVESGNKSRYIDYNDIYLVDMDYSSYSAVYSFDGEGAITSAIDYVVSDELPKIYALTGHGEEELTDDFRDQLDRENMELEEFSLLNEDEIPVDAACILIYAPASDISAEEKKLLASYVKNGGKLLVMAGPAEDGTLENLYSLVSEYGVEAADGIVVEGDREHFAFAAPYILLPDVQSAGITQPLIDSRYYVIVPIAQGLTVNDTSKAAVTQLLNTSDSSFSKAAGYQLDTYDKESGDTDGPFAVAVDVDVNDSGEIIWFSSSYMLDEIYDAYSSGANLDLTMNALAQLAGESEAAAIRTKSLNYSYLTISDSTASMLKTLMIGVFPAGFAAVGIAVIAGRRRRRDEQI